MRHGLTAEKIGRLKIKSPSTTKFLSTAIRTIIPAIGRKQSTATLKKGITVLEFIIESSMTITGFITDIIGKARISDTNTGTGPIIKSTMMIIDRL